MVTQLVNQRITTAFVEQPLASPRSAKYTANQPNKKALSGLSTWTLIAFLENIIAVTTQQFNCELVKNRIDLGELKGLNPCLNNLDCGICIIYRHLFKEIVTIFSILRSYSMYTCSHRHGRGVASRGRGWTLFGFFTWRINNTSRAN